MDWLVQAEKKYLWSSNWADWTLVRFCVFALGLMAGVIMHKKAKKPVFVIALCAFLGTVIPVAYKYFKVALSESKIY